MQAPNPPPAVRVPVRLGAGLAALLGTDDLYEDEILPQLIAKGEVTAIESSLTVQGSSAPRKMSSLWSRATKKAVAVIHAADPWDEFKIHKCPTELVLRHDYNASTGVWTTSEALCKMEESPFAKGAMRECFRMKKMSQSNPSYFLHMDWRHCGNYVAKRYMDTSTAADRAAVFEDTKMQMEAKLWGERFNALNPGKKVDFLQSFVIEFPARDGSPLYACERFVPGEYLKHNTNAGWVEAEHHRNTPQVFSHYTFAASCGRIMIVDIQGVDDLYTDPQFHTYDMQGYGGEGNLGPKGMALFFCSYAIDDGGLADSVGLKPFPMTNAEHERAHRMSGMESLTSEAATSTMSVTHPVVEMEQRAALAQSRTTELAAAESAGHSTSAPHLISAVALPNKLKNMLLEAAGVSQKPSVGRSNSVLVENWHTHITGQVHFELARYNFLGVLPTLGDVPDFESGLFHLVESALGGLGVRDALIPLRRMLCDAANGVTCTDEFDLFGRAQLSLTAQDSEDLFPFSDPQLASRAALSVADKLTTMLAEHGDRTALAESALICLRAGDRSGAVAMMQRAVDVSLAGLMPAAPELKIGDRVTCKYGGGSEEYPGSITAIGPNSTFDVMYDDGDAESSVARGLITLIDDDHEHAAQDGMTPGRAPSGTAIANELKASAADVADGKIPLLPVPEVPPLPVWNDEQEATAAMSGNATHQLMDRLASMLVKQDDDGRAAAVALWIKASELCMSKMQSKMAMTYQGKADEHA